MWTCYSESKEKKWEANLLHKWSGLPPDAIQISDIPITDIKDDKIHCISVVTGKKEALVMIPGFGGSGALYYRVMKGLSEKYDLYLVDMRGMGCSGRPVFPAKTQEEAEKYIVEGIEKWRQKMGLEKMIMCGHSLGGYIVTKYAKYYPNQVSSVLLISPAGVWEKPVDFNTKIQSIVSTFGFFRKYLFKKVSSSWAPGNSPLELLRNFGPFAAVLLNVYMGFYVSLSKPERKDVKRYMFQILMKPGTGEYAMTYFLHQGAYGIDPLEKTLNELNVPISIYYGTRDWVAATTPANANLTNPLIRQRRIKDASHQICTDKPKEIVERIVEDLETKPELNQVLIQSLPKKSKAQRLMNFLNFNKI
jgi:cardiolipin-specific phospholipase